MRPDPKMKKIINQQCKEVGIDISQGEEIWEMIGKFIKNTFREGNVLESESFKNIYIKGIGTYHSIPKRIYKIKEINKNKEINNELS